MTDDCHNYAFWYQIHMSFLQHILIWYVMKFLFCDIFIIIVLAHPWSLKVFVVYDVHINEIQVWTKVALDTVEEEKAYWD